MKITAQQAQDIIFEEYSEEFDIEEIGDWVSEGKYEICTSIISDGDKYYRLRVSRSGSPFTDWHYEWDDTDKFACVEVQKKEVVSIVWETV